MGPTAKLLGRRDILTAQSKLAYEDVDVPEWGGIVRVSEISGTDRDAFEASLSQGEGKKLKSNLANVRAKLVALSCVDGEGKRLFEVGDIYELGKKGAKALDLVFDIARKLSGLNDKDVEELARGNLGAQDENSSSN